MTVPNVWVLDNNLLAFALKSGAEDAVAQTIERMRPGDDVVTVEHVLGGAQKERSPLASLVEVSLAPRAEGDPDRGRIRRGAALRRDDERVVRDAEGRGSTRPRRARAATTSEMLRVLRERGALP